jgi:YhcH/YjgK/YiaL family protein
MIFDTIENHSFYRTLSSRIERGLAWLAAYEPGTADGRYDLEGDKLFALVQSYETVPAAQKKYEAHRSYADIQYIVTGSEIIRYTPVDGLEAETTYDAMKDFQLYHDPAQDLALPLRAGHFVLFFPHDAHKPGCLIEGPCPVKKVVIKVRL